MDNNESDKTSMRCLIKVGKREYIESLSTKGMVFMNSINFFREMEDDEHRKDIYEGIEKIEQITWIKMVLGDKEVEFSKNTEKKQVRLFTTADVQS